MPHLSSAAPERGFSPLKADGKSLTVALHSAFSNSSNSPHKIELAARQPGRRRLGRGHTGAARSHKLAPALHTERTLGVGGNSHTQGNIPLVTPLLQPNISGQQQRVLTSPPGIPGPARAGTDRAGTDPPGPAGSPAPLPAPLPLHGLPAAMSHLPSWLLGNPKTCSFSPTQPRKGLTLHGAFLRHFQREVFGGFCLFALNGLKNHTLCKTALIDSTPTGCQAVSYSIKFCP